MIWLFLIASGFIIYTYALFPIILHWRARGHSLPEPPEMHQWPSVSIVIAAHNERDTLPVKLASLDTIDYPQDKLELIIVNDGSTDDTQQYLSDLFQGNSARTVLHNQTSLGKCGALNEGVAIARNDIIVFMDARQSVSSNAIKALVPYLSDPEVGAATGELILSDNSTLEASNFGLYWRYEKWLRDNETRLFSTTGVSGALYAIRREDFIPNIVGTLLDDFETPISLLKQGKRTLYIPGACAFDKTNDDLSLEFRRKVRNLAGNWESFLKNRWLFSPAKNPVWWQFLSHKVFRLLVPFAMIIALVSSALGEGIFLDTMLWLQLAFYLITAASYAGLPGTSNKLVNFFKVFVQLNAAALVGTIRFFASNKAISWR